MIFKLSKKNLSNEIKSASMEVTFLDRNIITWCDEHENQEKIGLKELLKFVETLEADRLQETTADSFHSDTCKVCQIQRSSRFKFYGCKGVCPSCRSFFRRSVQTCQWHPFEHKNFSCIIDSKNRTSCKKCRFQR